MRYLIIETTWKTVNLAHRLAEAGILVSRCTAGEEIEEYHREGEHDLIVLDGGALRRHTTLAALRAIKPFVPICILSPNPQSAQIATWLQSGADSVIDDGADADETIARLAAVARRAHGVCCPRIDAGPLTIDLEARRARIGDMPLSLSPKLYAILEYLALRPGSLATREQLLGHVYGLENEPAPRVFDVYMCNLRAHLAPVSDAIGIQTVRGEGYRLKLCDRPEKPRKIAA